MTEIYNLFLMAVNNAELTGRKKLAVKIMLWILSRLVEYLEEELPSILKNSSVFEAYNEYVMDVAGAGMTPKAYSEWMETQLENVYQE